MAQGVEPHNQPPAILAIDDDAGERQHQHGWNGLEHGERPQCDFGMRGLQNVPGDGGGIHAAAQHRNHVSRENEAQRRLLQNGPHTII
jgi:hypothetical protein